MNSLHFGRKTWAKPNQKGQFGSDRLDIVYASEPETPPIAQISEKTHCQGENDSSAEFKSPSMMTFFDKRFTFGCGDGEGDENSVVDSTNIVNVQLENDETESDTKTSPRQTWDIFIHDSPKSDTKAVRNMIQAWREKEVKSFNNLSDSGGNMKSNNMTFLGDDMKVSSTLPHKRTLSSSIDQLNNIFNDMQADSSESDSQDGGMPSRGSLGYFKACATPQANRKFPQTKKTVTFVDHKSGKVTPTRRDRSSDGGQRSKLFDTPARKISQPIMHPMFRPTVKSGTEKCPDDVDLNDSMDSGVVVQEVSSPPARKLPSNTPHNAPGMGAKFKLNDTPKSPPPSLSNDDETNDDKVDATSNPFKNVLEQWQSNQKKRDSKIALEVKLRNKANDGKVVYSEDMVSKDNNNFIAMEKPGQFIYSPSQLKSNRNNFKSESAVFTFDSKDIGHKSTDKCTRSKFEVSPTLLDEFPIKLEESPVQDNQPNDVILVKDNEMGDVTMVKPIDEDIDLHNVQVHEKISMFEVKKPKQAAQFTPKITRGRQLPKPPSERLSLSEQFRHKAGKGRSESPSILTSASCVDIYRCDSPNAASAPVYETQSLARSRPKLRSNNAPKPDTNRARSRTPNFPKSSTANQNTDVKPSSGKKTVKNKTNEKFDNSKSPTSPRSNNASMVASIVSKMNKQKPDDNSITDQTQTKEPFSNRFRSNSSSSLLTAPIPFSRTKPPPYLRSQSIPKIIITQPDRTIQTLVHASSYQSNQNQPSVSGTAASKISKIRRKMPETPDSPEDSPRDNSNGRKTPELNNSTSGRITPNTARQMAGGRRTPEYFLRERHVSTDNKSTGGAGDVDSHDGVVVVTRGNSQPPVLVTNQNKSPYSRAALNSSSSKRQLPVVSGVSRARKATSTDPGKPPLQRSSSGRAFPDSQLFERRSEVSQKRIEKQHNTAQRLYNRTLPSTPANQSARPKLSSNSADQTSSHTPPVRRNMRSPSPSSQQEIATVPSLRQRVTSPSPTSRQGMASQSPALRNRMTSPGPRSGAASPSPRNRDRARSPWQMMLAQGKMHQPKPSMASLGRSIARCLTPNTELLDAMDSDISDTEEPYVPLLRGRSEPNLPSIFDTPVSHFPPTSPESEFESSKDLPFSCWQSPRRQSVSSELEGEDNEISEAFSAKQMRRKSLPRGRRQTVSGVPTMSEIERGMLPVAKLGVTSVSERFLRLSQGDLTAPTNILDELMLNPPKHRGVQRTSSLRDFSNPRADHPIWTRDVTASGGHGDGDDNEENPVKVFTDNRNGLVGYVFNV